MARIAIDAGHGLYTPGKRCLKSLDPAETREWVLNDRIANIVIPPLKARGHEVLRLDDSTGKIDVPLNERTKKANAWKADYLVSIHQNAGVNGGSGGGCIVIRQTGAAGKSLELQKAIYNAVIKHTGLKGNRSNPMPTQNLHMTRESKMPAVLIECGFMDSSTDVPIILSTTFAEKCAAGIVEGILAVVGGEKGVEDTMTEKELEKLVEKKIAEKIAGIGTTVSASLKNEFAEAKAAGITDGSNPGGLVTREQAAVMALRASKK